MKKVILVDDEAPARQLLKEYLTVFPELILLGEYNNGVDAVKGINEFRPDLLFLDIQMPGMTGFDVLTHLEEMPRVVFTTAYDQYALKAFEVHAVDYLLKPYTRERFRVAVQKALETATHWQQPLNQLTESNMVQHSPFPEKIFVSQGNKLVALQVSEIRYIQASGDYSLLMAASGEFLTTFGMGELEQRLPPTLFQRVHRSSIVNLHAIREIQRHPHSMDLLMTDGAVVRVGRSYLDKLKGLMF
jgi:two-component system LytT family response regulator